ncbi:hypothetical protein LMG27952_06005 [Paraburkholderia hiiakae]|uniref:Uncharacterized protein n=1 Tax=Paraburkholderia hiiakae TaxID=1081782 RepID=A0ABN7ICH1_9BURK|nr:hypothetical protein LMG27952_06005 [Paraburkholderia hiiakae]
MRIEKKHHHRRARIPPTPTRAGLASNRAPLWITGGNANLSTVFGHKFVDNLRGEPMDTGLAWDSSAG